jgi:hypothetical protein
LEPPAFFQEKVETVESSEVEKSPIFKNPADIEQGWRGYTHTTKDVNICIHAQIYYRMSYFDPSMPCQKNVLN